MPFNIPLTGRIEPRAKSWLAAGPADRQAFYRAAGELGVELLRKQLMRAIGADGERMKPRQRARADGANGPVLSPHDAESRTQRLLAFRATQNGVTLFWHGGVSRKQKLPWGTILGYHAAGEVIGAYIRDVRASVETVAKIRAGMATWWTNRVRMRAVAKKAREAGPPPPGPKPFRPPPKPHVQPRMGRPPEVVYLPKSAKPKGFSRKIRIYEID